MSEVTIPLTLLLVGTGAILWQMVRADGARDRRENVPAGASDPPPEKTERTEKTE